MSDHRPDLAPGDIVSVLHRGRPVGALAIVRTCRGWIVTADPWPALEQRPLPFHDYAHNFKLLHRPRA
jgi:hypothetical protein